MCSCQPHPTNVPVFIVKEEHVIVCYASLLLDCGEVGGVLLGGAVVKATGCRDQLDTVKPPFINSCIEDQQRQAGQACLQQKSDS